MKPVNFEEANVKIAEDQEQYLTLPAYVCDDHAATTISKWELNDEELKKILETKSIYLLQLRFRDETGKANPLQPINLFVDKPFVQKYNVFDVDGFTSEEVIKGLVKEGSEFRCEKIANDITLVKVEKITSEGMISINILGLNGETLHNAIVTPKELATYLKDFCDSQWIILNPNK